MNKNKVIALTLAAIYARTLHTYSSPSGVAMPVLPFLAFNIETLNYLRDKEGANDTKPGSKGLAKISKYMFNIFKLSMTVHFSNSGSSMYIRPAVAKEGEEKHLLELVHITQLKISHEEIFALYFDATNKGKGKKAKQFRKKAISSLREIVSTGRSIDEHAGVPSGEKTAEPA